ncbi:hypothetical protein D039_1582 [Vibrio parahaemolyticus EKP-028]|nr:hypothetical protein D039_1582 [Vibrio parahaemolyticus EKP-028]
MIGPHHSKAFVRVSERNGNCPINRAMLAEFLVAFPIDIIGGITDTKD